MSPLTWVLVGGAVVVVGWAWLAYNRFVSQRQLVANSWSTVDTELRRRYDLIPTLVATVEGYAAHERRTLEAVVAARTAAVADQGTPAEQASTENVLVDGLKHLLAVAEDCPELKADEQFLHLQAQLVATEDRIQAARRIFNGNVRALNERVQKIPSNLIARLGGFHEAEYFEVEPVATTAPSVRLSAS